MGSWGAHQGLLAVIARFCPHVRLRSDSKSIWACGTPTSPDQERVTVDPSEKLPIWLMECLMRFVRLPSTPAPEPFGSRLFCSGWRFSHLDSHSARNLVASGRCSYRVPKTFSGFLERSEEK